MNSDLNPAYATCLGIFEQAVWMARLSAGRRLRIENRIGFDNDNLHILIAEGDENHADTIIMANREVNSNMQQRIHDLIAMHNSAFELDSVNV